MNRSILFLLLALFSTSLMAQSWKEETPEQYAARMAWWNNARFGMFIHWGMYSVPAGMWKGQTVPVHYSEWLMQNLQIPVADYKECAKGFTAAKFDPDAWAKLAKDAGMKYVVITAKHHDGFAMFDTKVSDWNVKNSAAGRDLIAPLENAVRHEGLKFGLYYSQSQDWVNRGGGKRNPNRSKDGIKNLPDGGGWDDAHKGSYDAYLSKVAVPQIRELLEKYNPDVIWWDTPVDMTPERAQPFVEEMKRYPNLISNNRLTDKFPGDFVTPEQAIPARGDTRNFEVCMTMNKSWGFHTGDTDWKSLQVLLRNLSDITSKGGNFLLNIGPTLDGEIPPPSIERLQAIGQWMRVNGESIYGTSASPFVRRLPWGRVTRKPAKGGGETLYLQVWEWPADGNILLPGLSQLPTSGRLLANDKVVTATQGLEGLVVALPGSAPDENISVASLEFSKPVTVKAVPGIQPGADGIFLLDPLNADCDGSTEGNVEMKGTGTSAYLTNWTATNFQVGYLIQTPTAGKWHIKAEVAATKPARLTVGTAKPFITCDIPATGGMDTWQTLDLGAISLPKGENLVVLRPVRAGWNPINLRRVTLSPVP